MNVGLALCFPNAVSVLSRKQVLWEAWRQQTAAVTAGPISASKFSTVPVAFQVDPLAQPGTVTLYLVANRGVVKPTQTEIAEFVTSGEWADSSNGLALRRSIVASLVSRSLLRSHSRLCQ